MKKSLLVSMLLLGTSLFSMEHKHHHENHQNHQINSNKNIPQDAKCQVCGMFVAKYENWIASIKAENETFYFDGAKDMFKFYFEPEKYSKIENLKDAKIFVTEYYTLEQIDAKSAFFVLGSNVMGPMGSELIPFKDEDSAKEFKKEHFGTKILKFEEISKKDIPAKHH
ncbi:nitrous oxide reductase accessory protein NosL [Arcobacter vandammei]|uniref:nitrous oxide reductase accessory protein NosL n=1 Tax=Arcobacter vandammei TaxID=2782243 RepID=UPI0018DF4F73|nr:nitrous oxide reductase accessory protein NosL [Arcobacter vandammei]